MLVFAAGVHVWPTLRLVGDGIARTVLANPGAPQWAGAAPNDHVARLHVPHGLTTLECKLDDDGREAAVERARSATAEILARLPAAPSAT